MRDVTTKFLKLLIEFLKLLIQFVKLSNNFLEMDKLIIYLLFVNYSQTRKSEKTNKIIPNISVVSRDWNTPPHFWSIQNIPITSFSSWQRQIPEKNENFSRGIQQQA